MFYLAYFVAIAPLAIGAAIALWGVYVAELHPVRDRTQATATLRVVVNQRTHYYTNQASYTRALVAEMQRWQPRPGPLATGATKEAVPCRLVGAALTDKGCPRGVFIINK